MPMERAPAAQAPWPPNPALDKQKRNWERRPVGSDPKESFYTIAREKNLDPLDLVEYNFRTRNPQEINWYLRQYVGCFKATHDGLNYTFEGAGTKPNIGDPTKTKAVIFIPTGAPPPPAEVDPDSGSSPLTPEEKAALQEAIEFEGKLPDRPFAFGYIVGKITVSVKGKFVFLRSSNDLKARFGGREIGVAFAKKLSDDLSLQVGSKMKVDDIIRKAKSPKDLASKLREKTEVTLKKTFKLPAEGTSVALEGGTQLSATPIVIKGSASYERKLDLGPYLGADGPVPVAISATVQIGVNIGPSPTLLKEIIGTAGGDLLAAGGGLILLIPAFILLGAWDYGRRAENQRKIDLLRHYVRGYTSALFGGDSGYPVTGDPEAAEKTRLAEAGAKDAETDANQLFAGMQGSPKALYVAALGMLAGGPPSPEKGERCKRILEAILWKQLAIKYPPLDPPRIVL
ncbi:MAG: hypothetical protein KIT36_18955 [Alphaproteobacteria bacterium]|nr:hypothetical protein [Alphaproteobacteria bacterium]